MSGEARLSSYPGEGSSPTQILALADEYRRAAEQLLASGRRGAPLSFAPFRSTAIQAIELYLNALLLSEGASPEEIRGLQHELALRKEMSIALGLKLRRGTAEHLGELCDTREFLLSRYQTEILAGLSPLSRLEATLKDVAIKVAAAINSKRD